VPSPGDRGFGHPIAVAIGAGPAEPRLEAFVESVRQRCSHVEVDVLLADGRDATARISSGDWEWLEFAPGDIVPVRHLGEGALSE